MSRAVGTAVALLALWLVVSVVTGAQYWLVAALRGEPLTLPRSVIVQALSGVAWFPVGALVVALARRFPLRPPRWKEHLALHVVASGVAALVLNILIATLVLLARVPGTIVAERGIWSAAVTGFLAYLHVNVLVYAVIVALVHAAAHWRESRERELATARLEAQLAQARLETLRAQLHPHFLFNALHTIGLLWRAGRGDEAQGMLERLASLLRRALEADAAREVSLGEELDFVREYLEIERVRFRDRLEVRVEAAEALLVARVPAMLLQPLVENAVRHGIGARGTGGRVTVTASRTGATGGEATPESGGTLLVEVRDDGPGIAPHASGEGTGNGVTIGTGNGIGLRNTRERLAQLYGASGVLDVAALPTGGTAATVRLPFRAEAEE
jgi:signal transduction histidine kinase